MTAYKGELEIGKLEWVTLRSDLLILAYAFKPAAGQGETTGGYSDENMGNLVGSYPALASGLRHQRWHYASPSCR
ncbi:hypothetical protein AERO8C_150281 [Aeromonas veronii]|uniref:Uncharacterized protein n=1 Tax=Aeromonas veronii TaxID=654 RepID=A0A653KWP6_AERVE|nr:hypothetical protein AERO8C_150281 [Aeromonas veronii]